MTSNSSAPTGTIIKIATAAGGGFATFYNFYATASTTIDQTELSAGTRVSIVMFVVVAIQPILLLGRKWIENRRVAVLLALIIMFIASAVLPLANQWPGSLLLGLGFGLFVVVTTAWVKEQAASGQTGRALGAYGFGSAAGGALGAPIGLYAAQHGGVLGVAMVGSTLALCALLPASRATAKAPNCTSRVTNHKLARQRVAHERLKDSGCQPAVAANIASLSGHLLAVSLYAAALSSVGAAIDTWLPVVAAFIIQVSLAPGRFTGGYLSDRFPPLIILLISTALLALSTVVLVTTSSQVGTILTVAIIGFTSGIGQTAALDAMMRHAQSHRATETASIGWNTAFDLGLGIGAFTSGWVYSHD